MNTRNITQGDYTTLLELDKQVYPTDNPVTPKILDKWFERNPEFGIVYEQEGRMQGMCIAIPLNKEGWYKLISGELAEADLNSETIFDNNRDNEIGIHIYHIEKFGTVPKFYESALQSLSQRVQNLKGSNQGLTIEGFSALCVTSQGIGLFYNKLNCRERDFINSEHILKKDGKLEIFEAQSEEDLQKKLSKGYEHINRCKMLVSYPDEPSIIWKYLK